MMNHLLDYLKLTILKFLNINLKGKIKLAGYTVHFGSIKQLKLLFKEIFIKENYKCDIGESPYIIDGGANIGLAVLYFKRKYPNASIVAFEPNMDSYECLKKNVENNNLENVKLYNAALSGKDGHLTFYTSSSMQLADIGASAVKDHVDYYHGEKGKINEMTVESKALSPFIDKKVDLLKLDIEGSEGSVFKDLKDRFNLIQNCILEYHYQFENPENALSDILEVLEENRHAYRVLAIESSKEVKNVSGYIIKSKKVINKT